MNTPVLELCEKYVSARNEMDAAAAEIQVRTGREPEEFLDDMAKLLAPREEAAA